MALNPPKANPAEEIKTAAQAATSVPALRDEVANLSDLVGELLRKVERLERE